MLDHFLKNAWRWKCGLPEVSPVQPELDALARSEWSPQFERLMRNRLILGAMRYGRLHAAGKPKYDRIDSIIRRARQYALTGNDELLVDIANVALLEFEEGTHPNKHFHAADDGEHVRAA